MEQWCTTESCRLTAQACGHRGTTDRQLELEKFDTNELGLGFGLRCKSAIKEGEFFLEYTGDVMPLEEASHDQVCLSLTQVKDSESADKPETLRYASEGFK